MKIYRRLLIVILFSRLLIDAKDNQLNFNLLEVYTAYQLILAGVLSFVCTPCCKPRLYQLKTKKRAKH